MNFKCPYQAKVMKMLENVNNTNGSQRDWVMEVIILFFGGWSFAHRQPCAVADVQYVNHILDHGEKNPVFVLVATVENFTDL